MAGCSCPVLGHRPGCSHYIDRASALVPCQARTVLEIRVDASGVNPDASYTFEQTDNATGIVLHRWAGVRPTIDHGMATFTLPL